MSDVDIDKVREALTEFFTALNSDPGSLTLGSEVKDKAWELHRIVNPPEDKT